VVVCQETHGQINEECKKCGRRMLAFLVDMVCEIINDETEKPISLNSPRGRLVVKELKKRQIKETKYCPRCEEKKDTEEEQTRIIYEDLYKISDPEDY
jgi:hypothetical protein